MTAPLRKHRAGYGGSRAEARVVALSVSYQRDPLLARGMGLEHLQELVARVARPLLRRAEPRCSIAYAGGWAETEDNFTHMLLRLISAEQEENSLGGPDSSRAINPLINHSAWPHYLDISPQIEARWIHACRIVRVSQSDAEIPVEEQCADARDAGADPSVQHARAVTLSAMRRKTHEALVIPVPDAPHEDVPAADARVAIGGNMNQYSGFVPGVLEESLVALELQRPLYVLGGFGGAASVVAAALLDGPQGIPELEYEWHARENPSVEVLTRTAAVRTMPAGARDTAQLLAAFRAHASTSEPISQKLNTGLSDDETRLLMTTFDIDTAVRLVGLGLEHALGMGR